MFSKYSVEKPKSYAVMEFPDIEALVDETDEGFDSYLKSWKIKPTSFSTPLCRVLAAGIRGQQVFLGTTIFGYMAGISSLEEAGLKSPNHDLISKPDSENYYLDCLIFEFAAKNLICGVVAGKETVSEENIISVEVKDILDSSAEMVKFLSQDYTRELVNQLIFVPSEKFSEKVLGFSYDFQNLNKMIRF